MSARNRSIEIMKAARVILAEPKHWTKGAMARDATGRPCTSNSPKAVCWCIEGAIEKATRSEMYVGTPGYLVAHLLTEKTDTQHFGVHVWNDDPSRTHAEVLELLDKMTHEPETREETVS